MKSTPTQLHAITIRLTLNGLYMIIILAQSKLSILSKNEKTASTTQQI